MQRWPKFFQEDLSTVLSLLAEGNIEARVDSRLPLEWASEALSESAAPRAVIEARDLAKVYGRGENRVEAGEWCP